VLSRISCTALGLALLEDENKFKLGDVLALKNVDFMRQHVKYMHKMTMFLPCLLT
jgi:hypothetical protein